MKRLTKRLAVLWVLAVVLAPWAQAQTAGTCLLGSAQADLDINNVRARLFNNGGLFWKGAGNVYNVPKVLPGKPITPNALFASGIWLGGEVNGEPRTVAADYGNWELWPGPLDDNGELPGDKNCSKYDRIYVISREDVQDFEASGVPTPDLESWPVGLGAPTIDAEGNPVVATSLDQVIDLAAGQRPKFTGDQMAYWVMNDVGSTHATTGTDPMGLEVQVLAFSFNLGGALGNTTFYKYRLLYKGKAPLTNAYFGIWSDPDLGDATDDWVGSDTTLGLGFVYNADNNDASSDGYGVAPPALGYDFFQGPLVDAPGEEWIDPDSTVHVNKTRLPMTVFMYYDNITAPYGNPRNNTTDWYNYLQGIWQDGKPMIDCGNGYNAAPACAANAKPTKFMWPGDPVAGEFWSEPNFDGAGNENPANDRRFLMSTGPFVIQPGDVQEIVYGIVWAKGADNMDSVARMKLDDAVAQSAYDSNFELPQPPAAPRVNVTELDGRVILSWYYLPQDNNYLEAYEEVNPFSFDNGGDRTLNFEGYRIYRYPTEEFAPDQAELVAIYDVNNGVTRVIETDATGLTTILADGTDSGIQNSVEITGLTNYTQYYFAVEAYAYNGNTDILRIHPSPLRRVVATPAPTEAMNGGASVDPGTYQEVVVADASAAAGEGVVQARVIDPLRVTGDQYEVRFYTHDPDGAAGAIEPFITYDIVNATKNTVLLNGKNFSAPLEQREAIVVTEGLEFSVQGPPPGFKDFLTVANAAGPLDPFEYGAMDPNHRGFPRNATADDASDAQQVGPDTWGIHTAGNFNDFAGFVSRTTRDGANFEFIGAHDYEWRFEGTSLAWNAFQDGELYEVPFELWDIGLTPDDRSDDVRLIPLINENTDATAQPTPNHVFDIGPDHPTSGGTNDPHSDWVYWYQPADMSPGEGGYNAYVAEITGPGGTGDLATHELFARMVVVNFNGCDQWTTTCDMPLPEQGTIFRIVTFKPNQPGDVFVLDSSPVAPEFGVDSLATANIDEIGIVPNPYKGASAYEVSNLQDIARFVNMPERATIRIFTLSGTLIRTLEKSGPARFLDWDLQTEDALPIASGMYLIHVEVPGVGEKVIKFGVIKKRIQLDLL